MKPFRQTAGWSRSSAASTALLALWLLATCGNARGQQGDAAPFTLHVYNNLVQFPTIVLSSDLTALPPIPREKFSVTIDGGPSFHPTQMRREGDDPIALAVLLDAGDSENELLGDFPEAFSKLMPGFLHNNDHLSMYAQDCTLFRSMKNIPANEETAKAGVNSVLKAPRLHGAKNRAACGNDLHLFDALTYIVSDLRQEPGRRVILLLSNGSDGKSKTSLLDTLRFASAQGVAIFRLRYDTGTFSSGTAFSRSLALGDSGIGNPENAIPILCNSSGGMVLSTTQRHLAKQLQDFIMLLRNRYIIEFPRPDDQLPGRHEIAISIPGKLAFIRNTGASTPLPDPALQADPNTLPSTASPARIGTKKPTSP